MGHRASSLGQGSSSEVQTVSPSGFCRGRRRRGRPGASLGARGAGCEQTGVRGGPQGGAVTPCSAGAVRRARASLQLLLGVSLCNSCPTRWVIISLMFLPVIDY